MNNTIFKGCRTDHQKITVPDNVLSGNNDDYGGDGT
jgi:hypothetical protein